MILNKEELALSNLESWTRKLSFDCRQQRFDACVVFLKSDNLSSIQLNSLASQLPQEELADVFKNSIFSRQTDYVLGRLSARKAVLTALGKDPFHKVSDSQNLRILPGVFNQPVLSAHGQANRLGVSISHRCGSAVALAFDRRHPMALDLECIDPAQEIVFQQFVDSDELQSIRSSLSGLTHLEQISLIWTCKEALGKVMGCGLTVPSEFLAVAGAEPSLCFEQPQGSVSGWRGLFRNCPQFSWYAWKLEDYWLTVVAPAQSRLIFISPSL